jgi:hypothetical protein
MGGCAAARAEVGANATYRGVSYPFLRLPPDCVRKAPGVGRIGEHIVLPAARADSRTYLYGLLKTDGLEGAQFDCSFPAGFRDARVWISGQRIGCRTPTSSWS